MFPPTERRPTVFDHFGDVSPDDVSRTSVDRPQLAPGRSQVRLAHANRTAPDVEGRRLLTADQVAALLQVTRSWVYAETRAGRIPHVRLGRYVRFRGSAIARWVEELERGAVSGGRG
jgi:excisionase family DNA binding protein